MELVVRIELTTSSLPRKRSTPELHQQDTGAEDEVRTRDPQLGRLMLYLLSYFRDNLSKISYKKSGNAAIATVSQHFRLNYILWGEMDSNHRRRAPADLQSAPFGHSGISPVFQFFEPIDGFEPPTCCLQNSCSTD